VRKYEVFVLDYCITSNHVHLLLDEGSFVEAFSCAIRPVHVINSGVTLVAWPAITPT
jgi:hypothetical protein